MKTSEFCELLKDNKVKFKEFYFRGHYVARHYSRTEIPTSYPCERDTYSTVNNGELVSFYPGEPIVDGWVLIREVISWGDAHYPTSYSAVYTQAQDVRKVTKVLEEEWK